jgi:hypothetical protein
MVGSCYENGRWRELKKSFIIGNFIIQDHNTRPVGKPRTRWEAVVQRDTSHILGISGCRR